MLLLTCVVSLNAQTDSTSTKVKWKYAEIVGTTKAFSLKITIFVDYGQEVNIWKDNRVKDETGKVETFQSMVDAMNYMGESGWEFVQAYALSGQTGYVYHWLMKHKN